MGVGALLLQLVMPTCYDVFAAAAAAAAAAAHTDKQNNNPHSR